MKPGLTSEPQFEKLHLNRMNCFENSPLCIPSVLLVHIHLVDQHVSSKSLPNKRYIHIGCICLAFLQCEPSMVVMIIKLRHAGQALVGWLHISACCKTMNAQIRSRNEAKIETWESFARGCLS